MSRMLRTHGWIIVLLVGLAAWTVLGGCGGGSGTGGGGTPEPADSPAPYSALFQVDVGTGAVTVTRPDVETDGIGTAAVFTGTAVSFASSTLVDDGGDAGVKALRVSITNNTGRSWTNAHLVFDEFTNVASLQDIRTRANVTTPAQLPLMPSGVAVGTDGAMYATANHCVYKAQGGVASILAGSTSSGYAYGVGTAVRFNMPVGIAVNPVDGSLIVAEYVGNRIRRVTPSGEASLVAGTGAAGGNNGAGSVATFDQPAGVAVDAGGAIYVAEANGHRVRRITYGSGDPMYPESYNVTTLAGSGTAGYVDGVYTAAQFNSPRGIAVDADGNVYVADGNNQRIRLITQSKRVTTIAGTGTAGATDGYGDVATFRAPYGVAVLPDRGRGVSLIVSDSTAHNLRQMRLRGDGTAAIGSANSWVVQTLAGENGVTGTTDGSGAAARFNSPKLLCADASGSVYVADKNNARLRQVRPDSGYFPLGELPSGSPPAEPVVLANAAGLFPVAGGTSRAYLACPDLATGATSDPVTWAFTVPEGVTAFQFKVTVEGATDPYSPVTAVDGDANGNRGSSGVTVTTLAGSTTGVNGFVDGVGVNARFRCLVGTDIAPDGVVYSCDAENNAIRRIEPNGRTSTVAGSRGTGGYADGRGNVAELNYPCGLAIAPEGTLSSSGLLAGTQAIFLVVTDLDNDRIRLIRGPYVGWSTSVPLEPWNPAFYSVATIAGDGTSGYANGTGDVAQFSAPDDIAAGPGGIFYISERGGGNRIRTLRYLGGDPMDDSNWEVGLLAGSTTAESGYVDATGSSARFDDPRGLTVGRDGNIYVADTYNDSVRKITPDGVVTTLAGTDSSGYIDATGTSARFYRPWSIAAGPDGYLYVADRYNYRIRRVSPTGVVTTVAGTGSSTRADGTGMTSGHQDDLGIAVSDSGDLYVAEAECMRLIQRIVNVADASH